MKKSIVILFAAAGVLMSCAKEVSEPIPSSMKEEVLESSCYRIPVRMERAVTKGSDDEFEFCFEDDTKVNISSSTGAATWTAGDQIAFCQSNGVNSTYLTADVDPETSEISVILDDGYSPANYAIYPASAAGSNMTTPTVVYADSYDLDNIADEETFCMAPMVAVNNGGDLEFYHVGGVLRMSLNGVLPNVKKIRVTFTGMTYVTGVYTVSNPGTSSSTIVVSSGSHNYVEFTKSDDFPVNFWLNIPLPSGNYTACTGMTIGLYDSSSSLIKSKIFEFPWLSIGRARGKKEDIAIAIDLSCINTITRNQQARETANCYVVTEPGDYCLPLFYGNSIQNGTNVISTVAPSSYFWNSYGDKIQNSNIITDLTNYGYNASGGKLVWSTGSTNDTALVEVEPTIAFHNNVGYLFFSVPSSGFQEGSVLIGLLKSGSTIAYAWTWHIWITDGAVLDYNTYTNYAGTQINFLNRPLGGRGGVSRVCTYYQWGFPYPIPPSDGVNDSLCDLYTSEGSFTLSVNNAASGYKYYNSIARPDYPNFSYYLYGGTSVTQYNMWDATQSSYTDKKVVKTVYDPCPPGFSVPRGNSFTGFSTTGNNIGSKYTDNINKNGSFEYGWWMYRNYTDKNKTFFWPACGYVYGNTPRGIGISGYYWTAAPYASSSTTSSPFGHSFTFSSTTMNVESTTTNSRWYALPVCPALIEN